MVNLDLMGNAATERVHPQFCLRARSFLRPVRQGGPPHGAGAVGLDIPFGGRRQRIIRNRCMLVQHHAYCRQGAPTERHRLLSQGGMDFSGTQARIVQ